MSVLYPPHDLANGFLDSAARLAFRAAAGRAAVDRLSILIFHRVLPKPDPLVPAQPDRAWFDGLCAMLVRFFNVLPLDEAVERLATHCLPANAICLTFDDGYADNYDVALPVLLRYRLNATFFVATGYLDGGCMFNDAVTEMIRRTTAKGIDGVRLGLDGVGHLPLATIEQRRGAVDRLIPAIKYLDSDARRGVVSRVGELLAVAHPDNLMMSHAQVRGLYAHGMRIGAHTRTHPILAGLSQHAARQEIEGSRDDLESLLGNRVTLFAYPNGKPGLDYSADSVRLVRQAGFTAAVSTAWGAAGTSSDPFQLPRFTPWDRSRLMFILRLAWLLRRRTQPGAMRDSTSPRPH